MQSAVVTTRLSAADVPMLERLIGRAERVRGYRPVSDQFWLDLHNTESAPLLNVQYLDPDGEPVAYAQGGVSGQTWTIESVAADDHHMAGAALSEVVGVAVRIATEAGGTELVWLVQGPTSQHEAIAAKHGMVVGRRLHQMRRSLPTGLPFLVDTRDFEPDRDIDNWVAVNARAFAWNPEQRSWTARSVRARMKEPWFDPAGLLIHERDGRLAGFCWTKVHAGVDPVLGEIYVIAVDPDFHGLGLGRELTLAGLDHLANQGIGTGMLFVDGANAAAIHIYGRMGFEIHRTDSLFRKTLTSRPDSISSREPR